jgi:pimeloyl-ACP methyl ester carboxylesterase
MQRNSRPRASEDAAPRIRRAYFESRFGQLHVHNAIPAGGGFDDGTPLLCIHGSGATGREFGALLPIFGRDRSVYAPDLPGFGESDGPPSGAVGADSVAALADFVTQMRFRKIDVLGLREGVMIACELALAFPPIVRRVVFTSVPAVTDRKLADQFRLVVQPTLVIRPRDHTWESSTRLREWMPKARVLDLPGESFAIASTLPVAVSDALKTFLRG